jgi:c(7)-type cytochrome triheme protein
MKKNLLLIILLAVFCIANVGATTKGSFSDGGGILYTQPVKSVLFRHQHHVDIKKISCEKCHSGLFEMEALLAQEKKDFVMESLYRGRYCGACHNGKDAFAARNQCARCHPRISAMEVGHVKGKPKPYKAPVYNTTVAMGKDQRQILFKHEKHASLNCMDCHSKLFQVKEGKNKIALETHKSQQYCFNCHNGKKEFAWNSCKKCHKDWKAIEPYCLLTPKADRGSCVKCHTNANEMKALVKPPKIGGEAEG